MIVLGAVSSMLQHASKHACQCDRSTGWHCSRRHSAPSRTRRKSKPSMQMRTPCFSLRMCALHSCVRCRQGINTTPGMMTVRGDSRPGCFASAKAGGSCYHGWVAPLPGCMLCLCSADVSPDAATREACLPKQCLPPTPSVWTAACLRPQRHVAKLQPDGTFTRYKRTTSSLQARTRTHLMRFLRAFQTRTKRKSRRAPQFL